MPWFLPKTDNFFEQFGLAANNIVNSTRALKELFEDDSNIEATVKLIKEYEHEGDKITHETVKMLNKTFVTPIDREDIHALITGLDDVIDYIDSAASRYFLYKMSKPPEAAKALTEILHKCAEETVRALSNLQKFDASIHHICIELNSLENEADRVVRSAIARLFENEKDPIEVIKWKELFDSLEDAADKFEDVANTIEAIIVKHG